MTDIWERPRNIALLVAATAAIEFGHTLALTPPPIIINLPAQK